MSRIQDSGNEIMNMAMRLYQEGEFIMSIRYYSYKINLYKLDDKFMEVFYNHALDKVEKIDELDSGSTRMKFYTDQIRLPKNVTF